MADNWLTRQLREFVYGPPAGAIAALSAPIERRDFGYAGRYVLPNPISVGTLVHGPGATQLYRDAYGESQADNSAVAACLNAITRAYNEVPLRHYRRLGDDSEEVVNPSPLRLLLRRPNPHMTLRQLRAYWQWCKHAHGNAYVMKVRAGDPLTGEVVELWPVSPAKMTPLRYKDSTDFISTYRYYYTNGKHTDIDPRNVIHFKLGIDDENHMLGCSNLRKVAREIAMDNAATRFGGNMLANGGAASMIVSYPPDSSTTPEEAMQVKAQLIADFTGENVGAIGVLNGGAKAERMTFSPRDMDLTALHRLPEERIAAIIGLQPIVANLGAGWANSTYANFGEAREQFTEMFLLPEWADDGETLTHQLLSDFTDAEDEYLGFDIRDARALQTDETALFTRLVLAVGGPILTVDEAREEIGRGALTPEQAAQLAPAPVAAPATMPTDMPQTRMLRLLERKGLSERQIEALLLAARDEAVAELLPVLQRHQDGQRKRVIGRIGGG